MRSGNYDETSSNPADSVGNDLLNKTPSLPKVDHGQVGHHSFEQYSQPAFRVENNEHNITNISLSVSHMNMTADDNIIHELDEGETFRPNPQSLETQMNR